MVLLAVERTRQHARKREREKNNNNIKDVSVSAGEESWINAREEWGAKCVVKSHARGHESLSLSLLDLSLLQSHFLCAESEKKKLFIYVHSNKSILKKKKRK